MDLEDIFLPSAIIVFVAGFSLLILIAIPELCSLLHLSFNHFVASLVMLTLSLVLALLDCFTVWGRSYEYETPTFPSRETVRRVNNPKRKAHSNEAVVDPPTREQLHKLKEALGLDSGSLQFKRRGRGIYHVCYEQGKHRWYFIGSWLDLKEKLQG